MNEESMHSGIRSRKRLNSRKVCSTAHKRKKPMERTKPAYKKGKKWDMFLKFFYLRIAVVITGLFARQTTKVVHLLRAYRTDTSTRQSVRCVKVCHQLPGKNGHNVYMRFV